MLLLDQEYDIWDLQENFNSQFVETRKKIEFVSDSLCNTTKNIKTYKENNVISILNI